MKKINRAARTAACIAAVCMALGVCRSGGNFAGTPSLGVIAGAEAVIYNGLSGDTEWTLDDSGTLTISGEGAMEDYAGPKSTPFYNSPYGTRISNIIVESGVTSIGSYAFYGLKNLENITISYTVTSIGDDAFAYCTGLKGVIMPGRVRSVGSAAFSGTGITGLVLPDSVTDIKRFAVTSCEDLESVIIPAGISSIGAKAFAYNYALTDIYYKGTGAEWYRLMAQYGQTSDTEIHEYLGLEPEVKIHFLSSSGGYDDYDEEIIMTTGGVRASVSDVSPSGEFTVYFDIPTAPHNADTVSFKATFDPSAFEVVSWYSNDPTDSRYIGNVISGGMANSGNGFLSISATNASYSIDLSNSKRLSAQMRVKSSAQPGSYYIEIVRNSISYVADGGKESVELWDPDTKRVRINVGSNPIRGKVSGYGDNGGNVTVQLIDGSGKVIDTVVTPDGNYAFNKAVSGQTYTVRVSMPRCASREYTVTASSEPVVKDMTICRMGDVTGDGYVDAKDANQILRYDAGMPSMIRDTNGRVDEYKLSVAKVLGNSTLTPKDATQIMRYEAGYPSVFDTMT